MDGDTEALEELGLDSVTYPRPHPLNASTSHLQVTYNSVLNTAVASRELQLSFLEKQCQEMFDALQAIAVAKKIILQHEVDSTSQKLCYRLSRRRGNVCSRSSRGWNKILIVLKTKKVHRSPLRMMMME